MKRVNLHCHPKTLIGCFLVAWSGMAAAQASSLTFSLSSFMEERQLTAKDIVQVTSLYRPAAGREVRPFGGDANPAWFSLQAQADPWTQHKRAIKLTFATPGLTIEACHQDACTLVTRSGDKTVKFTVDDAQFTLNLLGFPCDKGGHCESVVPSWTLSQMVRRGGAMTGRPTTLTAVHHKGGLALFDAEQKKLWLELFNEGVPPDYGALAEISDLSDKALLVKFERAWLVLDFEDDVAIKADSAGLELSTQGLGALNVDAFRRTYTRTNRLSSESMPIFMNQDLLSWPETSVRIGPHWVTDAGDTLSHPEVFSLGQAALSPGGVDFLGAAGAVATIWRYEGQAMTKVSEVSLGAGIAAANLKPFAASLMVKTSEGIKVLSDGKLVPSTLNIPDTTVQLVGTRDGFVRDQINGQCIWRHYRGHATFANSFSESGLTVSCAARQSFGATADGVAVTSFNADHTVSIQTLKK